jgi:hypothetical protein
LGTVLIFSSYLIKTFMRSAFPKYLHQILIYTFYFYHILSLTNFQFYYICLNYLPNWSIWVHRGHLNSTDVISALYLYKLCNIPEQRTFQLHHYKPQTTHVILYLANIKVLYILLFTVFKQLTREMLQLCCTVCRLGITTGFAVSVGCEGTVLIWKN